MDETTGQAITTYESIDQIINDLSNAWGENKLPVDAILAARQRRDEIIPRLIEVLEQEAARPVGDDEWALSSAPFFALFLLTEFRAKEALPAIIKVASLPDECGYDLFGDGMHDCLNRTLAVLASDTPELIEGMISDQKLDKYVRGAAAEALAYLAGDGVLSREDVVRRLEGKLQEAIVRTDADVADNLVSVLSDLKGREALPTIRKAFELGLIDPRLMQLRHVERDTNENDGPPKHAHAAIDDTIAELSKWGAFTDQARDDSEELDPELEGLWRGAMRELQSGSDLLDAAPSDFEETIRYETQRVGRNEPCPCGSGRKYKKCCGKGGSDY